MHNKYLLNQIQKKGKWVKCKGLYGMLGLDLTYTHLGWDWGSVKGFKQQVKEPSIF